MITRPLVGYLAGAIRDTHPEDVAWREEVIMALSGSAVWLNPLGGKVYDPNTKLWTMSGMPSTAKAIVEHDFWAVDHADFIIFNFSALAEKYPNIGTLVEFGRSTARRTLNYAIMPSNYKGHENQAMYALHPFIEQNCAMIFPTTHECVKYLSGHLAVMAGAMPNFGGYVYDGTALDPWTSDEPRPDDQFRDEHS